jgi:acetyltransferase-like isoleucine patch superfamily enzyme
LQEDTQILTGRGGAVTIGDDAHIQRGCQLNAYVAPIQIGDRVEIAARCAFFSYDHGMVADQPTVDQPLTSKGEISFGDEA